MFHACADSGCLSKVKMEQIIVFMRNRESAFLKKGMFFEGELRSSVRISHRSSRSENFRFRRCPRPKIITSMPLYEMY